MFWERFSFPLPHHLLGARRHGAATRTRALDERQSCLARITSVAQRPVEVESVERQRATESVIGPEAIAFFRVIEFHWDAIDLVRYADSAAARWANAHAALAWCTGQKVVGFVGAGKLLREVFHALGE